MSQHSPRYLIGFRPEHRELWGAHPVRIQHNLGASGLFEDGALAELIEGYRREDYDLLHMAEQGTGNLATWEEGELGPTDGAAALEAIKAGRMWLNLRRVHDASPRHAALLQEVFEELAKLVPGFDAYRLNLGILLSSPGAQVYYHADVPGQSLWHLRGRKRVYVYPNRAPFLPEAEIERVILSFTEAEIAYQPWFDEHARCFELEPGEMLHWPLNAPHRVENLDGFNVSVTTEHWTTEIRNRYAVRYANGVLRNRLHITPPPPNTRGPSFWLRAALAAGVKKSNLLRRHKMERWVRWRLDPQQPTLMAPIEPYLL
ncbi:MAG: hypothetical protein ACI8S6_005859 [Myxococcota bacterium]